jgi:ribosome maturation factor RimP
MSLLSCKHHISVRRNGRAAPISFERSLPTTVYEQERTLYREVAATVERSIPGTEVLAVELSGPESLTVYIDHPRGVDHALCERVTHLLDAYRRRYGIDVSSPGTERPLRKRAHFERAIGRRIAIRTSEDIQARKRFRGELLATDDEAITLAGGAGEGIRIPYGAIVRANLI